MKSLCLLFLSVACAAVWAQTNAPAAKPEQEIVITADSGRFDGKTSQMVYLGHVLVTDNVKAQLYCGQLTVDLPPDGGHPTNIVAEADLIVTNVVIDYLDGKGQTNHITANKAIYAYNVVAGRIGAVTNETVTFTGGTPMPKVEKGQVIITGEPLIFDVAEKSFTGSHYKTILKQAPKSGNDTNASPFNFLK